MAVLFIGLLLPLLGTMLGSAFVFFMKDDMPERVRKLLLGFASGVMVAASVWSLLIPSMEMLRGDDLFFGTSITVTTENYRYVTSLEFIDALRSYGCKIVFYVEYVPTEPGTGHHSLHARIHLQRLDGAASCRAPQRKRYGRLQEVCAIHPLKG